MKVRAFAVAGLLGLACLVFNVLAVGGAAAMLPGVATQAQDESPLAHTYIVLHRYSVHYLPGVASVSRGLAGACFGDAFSAIREDPRVGLDLLFTASHGVMAALATLLYWAAPVLLLAFVLLYFVRPKTIHLIGR